jgi:hypothetical protein
MGGSHDAAHAEVGEKRTFGAGEKAEEFLGEAG